MPQPGFKNLSVESEFRDELERAMVNYQAREGRRKSWTDFLRELLSNYPPYIEAMNSNGQVSR